MPKVEADYFCQTKKQAHFDFTPLFLNVKLIEFGLCHI